MSRIDSYEEKRWIKMKLRQNNSKLRGVMSASQRSADSWKCSKQKDNQQGISLCA
jgi:hypothetical protein